MTTIYQFNCSANEDIIAFSTDKSGANIPAGNECNGEWVLYVENIINDSPENIMSNHPELFRDIEAKGWFVTSNETINKE
jgi:hypothetical protein